MISALLALALCAHAAWTPPAKPDAETILAEARADAQAGRHADALAKHLWFHEHANDAADGGMYGVRLSFALAYWLELGGKYPPALKAFKAERDRAVARLRSASGTSEDFHDAASLNEALKEDAKTAELFAWLHKASPKTATQSYDMAQAALIRVKNYALCGKYIDGRRSADKVIGRLRDHMKRLEKTKGDVQQIVELEHRAFSDDAAALVALLALNKRAPEVEAAAARFAAEWPDAAFRETLEKARQGRLPASLSP